MDKLTKAQEKLWNEIQNRLTEFKDENYIFNYFTENQSRFYANFDEFKNDKNSTYSFLEKCHKKAIESNIVFIRANTKTLKGLEELGYIQIMNIGGSFSDDIKVLK